tara:strand:+ start:261 stop:371 length:111 start_codon:yes stop_codon:yes gene_type:complete
MVWRDDHHVAKNKQDTKENAASVKPGGVFFLMQIFG